MWVIFQRELLIRGRAWSTWVMRMLVTLAALAIVAIFWLIFQSGASVLQTGPILFYLLFYGMMLVSLFEGLRTAALGITEERQEGTLGLLFLTPLSSLEVLLGKLAGAGLTSLYALIAVFPLLALPLLVGGVTGGEVFRAIVVLLGSLALSLACGLMGSARSREGVVAIVRASAWLMAMLVLPLLLELAYQAIALPGFTGQLGPIGAASSAYALILATDQQYAGSESAFWFGQLGTWTLAGLLVASAARKLRKIWRQDELRAEAPRPTVAIPNRTPATAKPRDATQTLAGVVARRALNRRWFWAMIVFAVLAKLSSLSGMFGVFGGFLSILFLPLMIAGLAAVLILLHISCRSFSEARRTGEMEILLTTPIEDRELVRTLWLALRPLVFWLVGISAGMKLAGMGLGLWWDTSGDWNFFTLGHQVADLVLGTLGSLLFYSACVWVGMWKGLSSRTTGIAVVWTFLMVVAVSWIVSTVATMLLWSLIAFTDSIHSRGMFGADASAWSQFLSGVQYQALSSALPLVIYAAWIAWARKRLFSRFRAEAARSEATSTTYALPRPLPPPLPAAPVA